MSPFWIFVGCAFASFLGTVLACGVFRMVPRDLRRENDEQAEYLRKWEPRTSWDVGESGRAEQRRMVMRTTAGCVLALLAAWGIVVLFVGCADLRGGWMVVKAGTASAEAYGHNDRSVVATEEGAR